MNAVYIIGDPHLSGGVEKPMDIFGPAWENHAEKLREHWNEIVGNNDVVVVNGDISWGLKAEEALPDLQFINELNGKKILMKGNHELWWSSMSKFDAMKRLYSLDNLSFLYNDAVCLPLSNGENVVLAGTRGWKNPADEGFLSEDEKVWNRELLRLENSLKKAVTLAEKDGKKTEIVAVLHFPPFNFAKRESVCEMTDLLEKYGVSRCYFGHVHGIGLGKRDYFGKLLPVYRKNGIDYYLTAGDFLGFKPELLAE